ncbi:medium-chain acyl-CoA ligase ACSF2, mitochondrial isoform X2 [Amia ocellicauda]|uniref:medium-chain acyl-CoA ligase ACSF2, mitochondrial isoform X2 n=1 Tax=Amia ocellicauda TaxID=2972642 RepID=UPI003463E1AF
MAARILSKCYQYSEHFPAYLNFSPRNCKQTSTSFLALRALHVDTVPPRPTLTTSYVHGTSNTALLSKTMGQFLEYSAEKWGDREALFFVHEDIRKTFTEFKQDVDQVAAGFLALGLKRGERMGIWGPNIYEWILFQFATAQAGIILVSVNPAYQVQELEFALRKVRCNGLAFPTQFKTQKYYEMLKQICPEVEKATPGDIKSSRLPDLRTVIVFDNKLPGTFQMSEVRQAATNAHLEELRILSKKLNFDDPINIQFTSGTTGSPKAATLTHHNIVNNAYMVGLRMGYDWRKIRACLPVPLYHCFGSVGGALMMAVHGISLVFPSPGYDGKATLKAIEKERCTFVYGTPTMYIDMLAQAALHKFDLSSVQGGIVAGSICPPEVVKKVMTELEINELTIGYGTTENSPVTFLCFPMDTLPRKLHTVGCVMNHTEAKVVDPQSGDILPLHTSGELLIRGYCVMPEYWDDPEKTKDCISNTGWYKTGDIASLDEYGYCKIDGRIKDMIIRGGENIYPAEIEQFLHTHPKIHEAQVVGVKDQRMVEEVCACIKLKEGEQASAEEIKAFCKGQISHFKIPRYVMFVQDYPLTVSGKIKKNILREIMEKEIGL